MGILASLYEYCAKEVVKRKQQAPISNKFFIVLIAGIIYIITSKTFLACNDTLFFQKKVRHG